MMNTFCLNIEIVAAMHARMCAHMHAQARTRTYAYIYIVYIYTFFNMVSVLSCSPVLLLSAGG